MSRIRTAVFAIAAVLVSSAAAYGAAPSTGVPRVGSSTYSLHGKTYMLGGADQTGPTDLVGYVDSSGNEIGSLVHLNVARAWHTATVLPDGSILVLGGAGKDGKVVSEAEIQFAESDGFELMRDVPVVPRYGHSVSVLTDGRLLISGGIGAKGELIADSEVWDMRTGRVERFDIKMNVARFAHLAKLLPDASVLITGGQQANGHAVLTAEAFDPKSLTFHVLDASSASPPAFDIPAVAETIPSDRAKELPVDALIAIRFNKAMDEATLQASSFSLIGPNGHVAIEAVSVEESLLVFLNPKKDLQPGSQYTVFIKGVADEAHVQLPFTAFSFSTKSYKPVATRYAAPRGADPEMWIPDPKNFGHAWVTGLPELSTERLTPKKTKALSIGNSLTGRVLRMNGDPLSGVILRLGNSSSVTDEDGDFAIQGFDAGTQVLEIDGTTANRSDASYGLYLYRAVLSEGENNLPFPVWMQKLDPLGDRDIASPLDQEVVLTTPAIPGLEIHLPKGTVIRDRKGKVVTRVNVTAIPTDRPPFPLTTGDIPTYFTLQPGGAWISNIDPTVSQGAQIVYPNYFGWPAGAIANFWNYDPQERGWYVYGQGQVNASGRQVIPNPGVAIYEFTGAMIGGGVGLNLGPMDVPPGPPGPPPCAAGACCGAPSGPPGAPPPGGGGGGGGGWRNDPPPAKPGCDAGGDPVSLSTGQFTQYERDLYLSDVMPIDLVRHYRSLDTNVRAFGIGMSNLYDVALWNTSTSGYADVDLVLPDGGRVHFTCTTSCTTYADAAYQTTAGGEWYMATLTRVNSRGGWSLVKRDGTEWFFPSFQPLKEVKDAAGNRTIITRRDNNGTGGPITRITSPNGRWIEFTVHSSGRITQAKDNGGRTFTYAYDQSYSRLLQVTDPNGGIRQYTWDATNTRITGIYDPMGQRFVLNSYDANGRVAAQTLADGSAFAYTYTLTSGAVTKTQVTDRAGHTREVDFNADGQVVSDIYPVGLPEQQTTTFEYIGSLQTAATDPSGRRTEYTYDGRGNLATITSLAGTPQAQTTTFVYTASGISRLVSIDGPMPGSADTTTYQWYPTGKLQRVTDPNGNYIRFEYDTQGRVTLLANSLEQLQTYTYSGADVASIADALGRTTSYFSDAVGRVVSVTDAAGNEYLREFDSLNHLVKATAPDGSVISFQYDSNGNLIGSVDERNNATTYMVNSQGIASGHTDALGKSDSVTFDASGRAASFTDRKGQVSGITYDGRGRVASIGFGATASAPTSYTSSITYTYKQGTDLIEQIVTSSSGAILFEYDAFDRVTKETTVQGSVSYTYNPDGTRSSMTVLGQLAVQYTYDVGGRLRQMSQGTQSITFDYDGANRRTGTTLANGIHATYAHDAIGQLTSIVYTLDGSAIGELAYGYDVVGRRTSVAGSLAAVTLPATATAIGFDANNRLMGWNGQAFSYDDNGNLVSDGQNTYSWNARNQLVGISGIMTATFAYDAVGRRISKTVNGGQTGFLYDDRTFVQELVGSSVKANILSAGMDQIVARTTSADQKTSSMLRDATGNVIAEASAAGAITSSYQYEPYGRATSTGSSDNSQAFTGREDDGTGLLYYRARYYMPGCGRFMSEDPIGIAGGMNLYQYVGGDPISLTDPRGLDNPGMGPYDPGSSHSYHIPFWAPCHPISVAAAYTSPWMSAPGAPAISQPGTTSPIYLWGNNPISQSVDFDPNTQTTTITNTTLPQHAFFPGQVVIQIAPAVIGTTIDIRGTGSGNSPVQNNIVGYSYFGGTAAAAALTCH